MEHISGLRNKEIASHGRISALPILPDVERVLFDAWNPEKETDRLEIGK
jgi:hypothetical protein